MDYLRRLRGLTETRRQTLVLRDQCIVKARQAGATWRSIALAAEMTELGVRKAAIAANEGQLPRPTEED